MIKSFAVILLFYSIACTSQKAHQNSRAPKIKADNSTEYELLVFDVGFESWYALKNSPALSRSKDYYHDWNVQYVNEWNNKVLSSRHSDLFGDQIDYYFEVDYPYEIENKLFYYFQYVEQVLRMPILRNGPPGL